MKESKDNIDQLLDHLFRHESGKLISVLTRYFGAANIALAEDVIQESLLEAMKQWPFEGVPDNPSGWLYQVSKNKAINALKRESLKPDLIGQELIATSSQLPEELTEHGIADDQLRMIFTCCHPSISSDSQIALILKTLCGFSIPEIAKAFFSNEETINKRLVRTRQKLREKYIPFNIPPLETLGNRVEVVLKALYLMFNEGYSASTGRQLIKQELCLEAIRLTKIISGHEAIENKAEAFALLALMQFNASRFPARTNSDGSIAVLADQDRSLWDRQLIQSGLINLEKSAFTSQLSAYHLLATISAYHCIAPSIETTDWPSILNLYDHLSKIDSSPVVLLNRAVAVAKVKGADRGIIELECLEQYDSLKSYSLFYSTKAEFYFLLNDLANASLCFEKAIELSPLTIEKEFLHKKLMACKK